MPAAETPIAVLDRVASLMDVLDGRPSMTLAQIARLAGLPRSSAHRMLQRLVELQWVERTGFRYGLGIRVLELGAQVARRDGVRQAAVPVLHDLHRSTGLTASLVVLVAGEVVELDVAGPWTGRAVEVGGRQPAVHCAAGRALLAELDPAEWTSIDLPAPPTRFALTSGAQLVRELHAVRARDGLAVDVRGAHTGRTAIAVPVALPGSSSRTALALTGPAEAVRVDRVAALLRAAAADVRCAASGVARLRPRTAPSRPVLAAAHA